MVIQVQKFKEKKDETFRSGETSRSDEIREWSF